ncbi:MAG: hypothetical protein ACI80F_001948, partial [Natronomonas sp.]
SPTGRLPPLKRKEPHHGLHRAIRNDIELSFAVSFSPAEEDVPS